jgi:predicted DNA-binding transcriptional regulator AlpA
VMDPESNLNMTTTNLQPQQSDSALYTIGDVAKMIGRSIMTIYRWEGAGLIPKPSRVGAGQISLRAYTEEEVAAIREVVQPRWGGTLRRLVIRPSSKPGKARRVAKARRRAANDNKKIALDPAWARMLALAAPKAKDWRSVALVVRTNRGRTLRFEAVAERRADVAERRKPAKLR